MATPSRIVKIRPRDAVTLAPVIVGALNWGLVGLFNVDLVRTLTGTHRGLRRAIYTAVGAAGAYTLWRSARAPTA